MSIRLGVTVRTCHESNTKNARHTEARHTALAGRIQGPRAHLQAFSRNFGFARQDVVGGGEETVKTIVGMVTLAIKAYRTFA